jgi:hypothetical protein
VEGWNSVLSCLLWDKIKPVGSHTTTKGTNRRQDQEFRMALRRGGFAGLLKKSVFGRDPTCKGQRKSELQASVGR